MSRISYTKHIELSAEEKTMLKTSVDSVQKVVDIVKAKA